MGGIFLNYRRHDERLAFVRGLYERLAERFGAGTVFLDSASIGHGRRYPNQLRRHLDRSDVVVVVVHDGWARELRTDGTDWVHNEIRWALDAGKTIIPVLFGGARMPRAQELPRTIRELANFQAHRADDDPGHDLLVDKIAAEPRRRAAIAQTPPKPWAGPVAGVAGAVAFAAPVVLVPGDWQEAAVYLSVFGVVVLAAVLFAVSVVSLARKPLNTAERLSQYVDPTRYHLAVGAPLLILLESVVVAFVFSSPVDPQLRPFLVVGAGVGVLYLVFLVLGNYQTEKFREDHWPVRLRHPVKPAPVRRELERLRRKHATADAERVRWHLVHLENAADVLARDASRGRWRWLTSDPTGYLVAYTAWAAASVGLLTSAALPAMRLWVPAVAFGLVAAMAWATVEAAFRRQRWVRREVADEVHVQVQRIQDRVTRP
ncbi:TIR domain-containing protein [Lentzea sp. NPDC042327]|uniref:TIR domain-containing protein n=1 Tax=Lentzea sp. NPDC042327 TaxID=3154801 RepID=UPI0033CA68E2